MVVHIEFDSDYKNGIATGQDVDVATGQFTLPSGPPDMWP